MKITLNTKTGKINVGKSIFGENMDSWKKEYVENQLRSFLINNTHLSDYEIDCMWMSYRYAIGRHTGVSIGMATDIWNNCKGRMSKDRQLFTAFDINREIKQHLCFHKPYFHFPLTSLNKIYTTAIDIILNFMEEYEIKSIDDLIKYRDIYVKLSDNERGYSLETVTWEEYLRPKVHKIVSKYYGNNDMSEDFAWKYFESWKSGVEMKQEDMIKSFEDLTKDMPNKDHYYMHDFEDLFSWNDLVHCFDFEHHHKSILVDGTECEWFWSWANNTEQHDDGYYYRSFGYHRIRVPVNEWNGNITRWIPDEAIKEDIY